MTHVSALKSLQREHQKHLEREKALGDILDNLRTGYNPNYQDMAVLEAVRGWEQLAGLPHINDVGKDAENENEDEEELGSDEAAVEEEEEEIEEGMWTAMQLEHQLDDLLNTDYEALLIEQDKHVGAPASPTSICEYRFTLRFISPADGRIVFNLSAYLPDALVPQYEALRDQVVAVLEALGLSKGVSDPAAGTPTALSSQSRFLHHASDTSKQQKALNDAEHSLRLAKKEKEDAEKELARLFDPEWYGAQGEWKKLHGTCIDKEVGE